MKRRHLIASIIALFAGQTLAEERAKPISCPWPGCRKKGRIVDGDIMAEYYRGGKILKIHAFHILEAYSHEFKK